MTEQMKIDMTDGNAPTLEVAILVCPGYNPVDIIGPHTILGLMPG